MLQSVLLKFASRFVCAMTTEFKRVQVSVWRNASEYGMTHGAAASATLNDAHVGSKLELVDDLNLVQFLHNLCPMVETPCPKFRRWFQ